MKVGNVSQTVLKRSVLKQLHTKRKEILTDLSVEEMCTAVQIRDTEDVVFASAVVSGNSKNIGVYAIMRAVLDLETRGASAIGVSVQVILPTYAYESRLKEMFRCMEERCASWGIAITCAKAETSPAVSQSVVSVTAAGSVEKGQLTATDVTGNDILNSYNYGIVILTEPILVTVPGNIVYASDNVEITGKKTARVLSETEAAGETEEPETTADGAISLSPVNSGQEKETEGSSAALAYILYE